MPRFLTFFLPRLVKVYLAMDTQGRLICPKCNHAFQLADRTVISRTRIRCPRCRQRFRTTPKNLFHNQGGQPLQGEILAPALTGSEAPRLTNLTITKRSNYQKYNFIMFFDNLLTISIHVLIFISLIYLFPSSIIETFDPYGKVHGASVFDFAVFTALEIAIFFGVVCYSAIAVKTPDDQCASQKLFSRIFFLQGANNRGKSLYYCFINYSYVCLSFSFILFAITQFDHNSFKGIHRASFLDHIYLSLTTLSTVGYGDAIPVTPIAKFAIMAEIVFGVVYVAFFISSVSSRPSVTRLDNR